MSLERLLPVVVMLERQIDGHLHRVINMATMEPTGVTHACQCAVCHFAQAALAAWREGEGGGAPGE